MKPLVWVMKKRKNSSQHMGLPIFTLIILLGLGTHTLFSAKGTLGPVEREKDIFIHVTGAVKKPGVYAFDREPSLRELMTRAGYFEAKLIGPKVWDIHPFFAQGTSVQISSENGYLDVLTGPMPAVYKITLRIPISLNTACLKEIASIPGIGSILAKKIIDYRSLYGPFKKVEDIKNVSGMGKLRYLKIKPYVKI